MIFLDREEQVFEHQTQSQTCPKCGHHHIVKREKLAYLRWFFLPFVPLKTSSSLFCYRCCRESKVNDQQTSVPFTSIVIKFTGLFILLLSALWLWRAHVAAQALQQQYIAQPKAFDILFIDESRMLEEAFHQPRYQIAQIQSIDDNQVSFALGNYSYKKQNQLIKAIRLDNLMIPSYFSQDVVSLSRSEFDDWFAQQKILEIHRPKNLSLFGGVVMPPQRPKAFRLNLPSPAVLQGVDHYVYGNLERAYELFSQAAERGDAWAQINLAQMYQAGDHVAQDLPRALYWYQAAADQGLKEGKLQLAQFCQTFPMCAKEQ